MLPYTGVHIFIGLKVQHLFCFESCTRGERGRKGRECKFRNKSHRTFDPKNTSTPLYTVYALQGRIQQINTCDHIKYTAPTNLIVLARRAYAIIIFTSLGC